MHDSNMKGMDYMVFREGYAYLVIKKTKVRVRGDDEDVLEGWGGLSLT